MIAIAEINTNVLSQAMQFLNEKRYGLGKDPEALKLELKKRLLVKLVIDNCKEADLNYDLRVLINKYN